jgi:hypothetical protein
LKAGTATRAAIRVDGRGTNLDMPPLPIASLPVTVQLQNSDGSCWEATFSVPRKNQTDQFRAKTP